MMPESFQGLQIVIAAFLTFMMMLVGTPVLIRVAYLRRLFDKPDGSRKVHRRMVPAVGGVMLFIAIGMGFSFSGVADGQEWYPYVTGSMMGLFFIGLKDDLVGLSPLTKLGLELTLCTVAILGSSGVIQNFGGVFGIDEVPYWAGFVVTLFTMIVVMNAYNLIDGIDGLAGGIGAIAAGMFGMGYLAAGMLPMAVLSLVVCVSLVGYLFHNFHPASIFMGDSGSLSVGFLLAFLAIHFIPLSWNDAFHALVATSSPVLPVAILSYPLYDTIRSFIRRVRSGRSPFSPDRQHIHHVLMDLGLGQRRTVVYLCAASMFPASIAWAFCNVDPTILLMLVLGAMLIVFPTNGFKRRVMGRVGLDAVAWIRPVKDLEPNSTREARELRWNIKAGLAADEAPGNGSAGNEQANDGQANDGQANSGQANDGQASSGLGESTSGKADYDDGRADAAGADKSDGERKHLHARARKVAPQDMEVLREVSEKFTS